MHIIIGKTFGKWVSPIFIGLVILLLRIIVFLFMFIDRIFIPKLWYKKIEKPIIIVGNPRSGTTFLHRFLVNNAKYFAK